MRDVHRNPVLLDIGTLNRKNLVYVQRGIESGIRAERIVQINRGAGFEPRVGYDHFAKAVVCRSVCSGSRQHFVQGIVRKGNSRAVALHGIALVYFQLLVLGIVHNERFAEQPEERILGIEANLLVLVIVHAAVRIQGICFVKPVYRGIAALRPKSSEDHNGRSYQNNMSFHNPLSLFEYQRT